MQKFYKIWPQLSQCKTEIVKKNKKIKRLLTIIHMKMENLFYTHTRAYKLLLDGWSSAISQETVIIVQHVCSTILYKKK